MLSPDLVLSSSSTIYPLFVGTYCLLQSRKLPETGSHLRPAFNGDCTTLVCSRPHVDLIFFLWYLIDIPFSHPGAAAIRANW